MRMIYRVVCRGAVILEYVFVTDAPTPVNFSLSLHDALPILIILLLHFLSLMLGSVLVLMLPLLVWLTPDLRIKKSLLKCNWTIRKRLPRCKMRLKKRLLAFSRRLHARIRKT